MDPWQRVTDELRRMGWGHDHADDVQEALLRTLQKLGTHADCSEACRFGCAILPRVQADRLRRRRRQRLAEPDEIGVEPSPEHHEPLDLRCYLGPALTDALGRRALEVLGHLFAGIRTNKQLARVLATSPAAIRKRRERIRAVIAERRWASESPAQ